VRWPEVLRLGVTFCLVDTSNEVELGGIRLSRDGTKLNKKSGGLLLLL